MKRRTPAHLAVVPVVMFSGVVAGAAFDLVWQHPWVGYTGLDPRLGWLTNAGQVLAALVLPALAVWMARQSGPGSWRRAVEAGTLVTVALSAVMSALAIPALPALASGPVGPLLVAGGLIASSWEVWLWLAFWLPAWWESRGLPDGPSTGRMPGWVVAMLAMGVLLPVMGDWLDITWQISLLMFCACPTWGLSLMLVPVSVALNLLQAAATVVLWLALLARSILADRGTARWGRMGASHALLLAAVRAAIASPAWAPLVLWGGEDRAAFTPVALMFAVGAAWEGLALALFWLVFGWGLAAPRGPARLEQ